MSIDSLSQLRQWQPPYHPYPIIEDNLLLPETALFLFGSAKSWKTMHSMHLAFCIATGQPWFGYETRRSTILKVQAELPKYQDKIRIMKYASNLDTSPSNIFFHTPEDNLLLDTTYGNQMLMKCVEEVQRRTPNPDDSLVIVIDPVYLLMKGRASDEEDVKKLLLNLTEVRKKYRATFIVIHHSRLTKTDNTGSVIDLGAEEVMGSSLWNNWCDTMIRSVILNPYQGADTTKISFAYHRNAQRFHPPFTVRWRRHNLTAEVTQRDMVEDEEPSVRNLVGG